MDQRTLREYYTAQFRDIVKQAHPGSIMSSYNEVNGVPAAASVQLIDTLARADLRLRRLLHLRLRRGLRDPGRPPLAAAGLDAAPLDQYGRTAYANAAGEDLDCNCGLPRPVQLREHRARPRSRSSIKTETDIFNVGDVDTSLVRLFTARIETGEFDAENQRAVGARPRRAPRPATPGSTRDANNAVTETPAAARPGAAESPSRASCC